MSDSDINSKLEEMSGGTTTGEWGIKVYGNMGEQTTVPGSNVIQIRGGDKKTKRKSKKQKKSKQDGGRKRKTRKTRMQRKQRRSQKK